MRSRIRTLAAAFGLVLVAAAVARAAASDADPPPEALPAYAEEIYVTDEVPLVVPVGPGEPVRIVFGVGELRIASVDGDELRAELVLDCRDVERETCLEHGKRLRVEPRRTREGLEVRMGGLSRRWLRKIGVTGTVRVPRTSTLDVSIGIGDVDISAGDEDLAVTMGIGDLTIDAPGESVGAVRMRTRIGDATLVRDGRSMPERRAMLIGARANWQGGAGPSSIAVRLRIGDATVLLH